MALGDYVDVNCHACIGGTNVRHEMHILENQVPHVVVGTPGRVFDMINRRALGKFELVLSFLHDIHSVFYWFEFAI